VTGPIIYLLDRRDAGRTVLAAGEGRLSLEDRARLARFGRAARREQFVLGRVLLRWAAARAMGAEPDAIEISRRADGRARVVAPGLPAPRFSLSHSGDWVACAVHPSAAIGVDVECMDATRDLAGIAALTFGVDERAWMLGQPSLTSAFYQLWTGREALTKLAGELASPAGVPIGSLVANGSLAAAPAPAFGWHHTEVRPGVALSLTWAGDVGPVRIEFPGTGTLNELLPA
jgi:4'-phosphopantetheinyl transferase